MDIYIENSYPTVIKKGYINNMKEKILNSFLVVISLIISFVLFDKFNVILEINQRYIDNNKSPKEITLVYDQVIKKIENGQVTNKDMIKIFETSKVSDISAFEYQASFSEVLEYYKSGMFTLLTLQAFIFLILWWSLTFPKKLNKNKVILQKSEK